MKLNVWWINLLRLSVQITDKLFLSLFASNAISFLFSHIRLHSIWVKSEKSCQICNANDLNFIMFTFLVNFVCHFQFWSQIVQIVQYTIWGNNVYARMYKWLSLCRNLMLIANGEINHDDLRMYLYTDLSCFFSLRNLSDNEWLHIEKE